MHITLDIDAYDERPSTSFPGFTERLTAWLPGLQPRTCSLGRPGGFVERLRH
jgi:cyanophycin synthetase